MSNMFTRAEINDENNSYPQRIYFKLKTSLGPYFQITLLALLLILFSIIALASQSQEQVIVSPHSFVRNHNFVLSSNNTTLSANDGNSSLTRNDHVQTVQHSKSAQADWMYVFFSVFVWIWFLQVIKRIRDNHLRRNSFTNNVEGARMLAQLMQMNGGRLSGLSNRMRMALLQRDFTGDDYEMLQLLDSDEFQRLSGSTPANRGISDPVINMFPVHRVSSEEAMEDTQLGANDQPQCNVCLGPYELGDEVRTLPCRHKYHKQCIDPWLRTNAICPICKCSVIQRDDMV